MSENVFARSSLGTDCDEGDNEVNTGAVVGKTCRTPLPRCVPSSFNQDSPLAEYTDGRDWMYDFRTGHLSFGGRTRVEAELLGTESEESGTWLWAWANHLSDIPLHLLAASLRLKAIGEEQGIPVFTQPLVPLEVANGETFASIAISEGIGTAYFRAPYVGGAAFLLIMNELIPSDAAEPLERLLTVFPRALMALECSDHREALCSYLEYCGIAREEDGDALVVREQGEDVLRAEFDELGRLRELKGTLGRRLPMALR